MKSFTFKGAAARRRREELGLRVTEVAEKAGISAGHLRACETGQFQPSAPTYMRICAALDTNPEELREPVEDVA